MGLPNIYYTLMIIYIFIGIFGFILGSFFNCIIYRLPRSISIFSPGKSFCPKCGKDINIFDNIPVISYLILLGKCRNCKSEIPVRYPVVELMTGVLFFFAAYKIGLDYKNLIPILSLYSILIIVFFIDFELYIIPDELSIGGMALGLIFSGIFYERLSGSIGQSIVLSSGGLVCGGGILLLLGYIWDRFFHKEAIGGGDIKLLAMIGAFVGLKNIFYVIFLSSILGTIYAAAVIIIKRSGRDTYIPFGPFLSIGAIIITLFPQINIFF